MNPKDIIARFDSFLDEQGLQLEAVVIGGTALSLMDVVTRQTRDCDVLDPEIPQDIAVAARAFASARRLAGEPLDDEWFNNGPRSLVDVLPPGWRDRLQPVFEGKALRLQVLGRPDLLKSKLFALCDRGLDIGDCVALAPTAEELAAALPWLRKQDLNPDWPEHVRDTLADLGRRLDHGT